MAPKKPIDADELMIVNDSPGEECRIAILKDNHLEELYTERTATATNVGNIYKGRVVNVESAIQAAFIDFGEGTNGFLHISDLHPRYFPGEERTERVGKKIPRRDRPPIQAALRRGDEILVQVLKEGIGTKGPTLTSYLSSPGRLLVLMPDMDRVGVSRKVEDEEKRREMRQILDSLELPDGFGFILRTAGFGQTKTELKRDAAYLMRLWKVMDKRIKKVGAPCELYRESDLLIRTVRDVLRASIKAIIVDSESAYERISAFLRVVTPRSAPSVLCYRRHAPIFHAFDIERQIELIHSREVPLPSGGRLVIDQTEALVAIDVNSGRSRSARDSETNAYETNMEAADEICRQLRLRDLGGLIVNDLIDMRFMKHRKSIEERFTENLKRDRAKATALAISEFGILEMTRQRMRPSIRKSHFMACAHCNGFGEIKVPEYVAADAVRHVGFLLQTERVARVELVCSPRVASVLLSGKRRELVRLEDATKKKVDVRVSEAIAVDRVDYYAYDDRNADIDITRLPPLTPPTLDQLVSEQDQPPVEFAADNDAVEAGIRRRRRSGPADATTIALAGEFLEGLDDFEDEELEATDEVVASTPAQVNGEAPTKPEGRRRRRRGRRGRGGGENRTQGQTPPVARGPTGATQIETSGDVEGHGGGEGGPPLREIMPGQPGQTPQPGEDKAGRRRRRRRRRRGGNDQPLMAQGGAAGSPIEPGTEGYVDGVSAHDGALPGFANGDEFAAPGEANSDAMMNESDGGATNLPHVGPRRKRRRRGRGGSRTPSSPVSSDEFTPSPENTSGDLRAEDSADSGDTMSSSGDGVAAGVATPQAGEGGGRKRRKRRRGRRGLSQANGSNQAELQTTMASTHKESSKPQSSDDSANRPLASHPETALSSGQGAGAAPKKKRRLLYKAARGAVSPTARQAAEETE